MYSNQRQKKGVSVQFYCTKVELAYIRACAKKSGKTISAYVRRGAVQGFEARDRSLPTEVLVFQGQLAHVCGLLEVIGRKRLDGEELNALERAQLNELRLSLQEIFQHLKKHLS